MSIGLFLVVAMLALGSAAASVRVRRARRLARTVTRATIATAAEGGSVRVVGAVVATHATLTAPMTGRRCAGYEVEIALYVGGRAPWSLVALERRSSDLVIADATGVAIVELAGAVIDDEVSLRIGHAGAATPDMLALCARVDAPPPGRGRLRYQERALEVGAEVAVIGRAVREPDPDGHHRVTGYREGPPTRLRFTGTAARPLRVTDDLDALA
ncbi:MAG: hypothetical protein IPL61_17440 [Myxococcales bacterium]|nr:hypothetical protein [Myxococcales bacterium]